MINTPFIAHSELTNQIYIVSGKEKYLVTEQAVKAVKAIRALGQESQTFKWCTDCKEYDQEKHCCHRWSKVVRDTIEEMKQEQEPILDKIKAEIAELSHYYPMGHDYQIAITRCIAVIDKYKSDVEPQESEDKE